MKSKKAQLANMLSIISITAVAIIIAVIAGTIGAKTVVNLETPVLNDENNFTLLNTGILNATDYSKTAIANLSGNLGTIATVVGLALVIGILLTFLLRNLGGTER